MTLNMIDNVTASRTLSIHYGHTSKQQKMTIRPTALQDRLQGIVYVFIQPQSYTFVIAGPTGDTGTSGPNGAAGVDGVAGPKGSQGGIGPSGDKGSAGSPGTSGGAGFTGATGQPGPRGSLGTPGPQGLQGPPGVLY